VLLQAVRVEHADLAGWLQKNLRTSDYVVIESTTNAWHVYDLLCPFVERVVVANPIQVKQIAKARVKTDIRDTLILARLLVANLVPDVWVPPAHVREMRQLLSQRRQLVETHTQIVNRMHSVAHRHHLKHERGKRFTEKTTGWQKDKQLSSLEQFQLALEMENRAYLEKQIERISKEVRKMSHQQPWAENMTYLMQLPGFGVITELFGTHAGTGTEWDQIPGERHYQGRSQGIEMGHGRSSPASGEVRPSLESSFPRDAETHAPQPGDRGSGSSSPGTGLVCPNPTPTLPPLQPGTHCLQISDLGLADG
jgi:hypothetical protein